MACFRGYPGPGLRRAQHKAAGTWHEHKVIGLAALIFVVTDHSAYRPDARYSFPLAAMTVMR